MSSIDRGSFAQFALAGLLMLTTAASSVGFTARGEGQHATIDEEKSKVSPNLQVAAFAGVLAAYGWVAGKVYDLGKEVGRGWAQGSVQPKRTLDYVDLNYEQLLD
jgi:hypothetical protein